jgi:hypothetical protein
MTRSALDIETSISMAPGLTKVVLSMKGRHLAYSAICWQHRQRQSGQQISSSWLIRRQSDDRPVYQSWPRRDSPSSRPRATNVPIIPVIHPISSGRSDTNVTLVGGTTLTTTGPHGVSYVSEKASGTGAMNTVGPDGYFGSGGGISTNYGHPRWQQGINMTAITWVRPPTATCRMSP